MTEVHLHLKSHSLKKRHLWCSQIFIHNTCENNTHVQYLITFQSQQALKVFNMNTMFFSIDKVILFYSEGENEYGQNSLIQ